MTEAPQIETTIVKLLSTKDRGAIKLIYDNYGAALYGIVLRIVGTEEVAEDVIQDAFVKIWKNGAAYDNSKGRLFTWMVNICRNTAIDKVRSKGFKKAQKIQSAENYDIYGGASEINVDAIGLKEIVDKLEKEYRVLIEKAYFEGYTQKEISEELEIPLGTVKTRIRAAIVKLRQLME